MKNTNPAYAATSTKPTFVESELKYKPTKTNESVRYYVPFERFQTVLHRLPIAVEERDVRQFGKSFKNKRNFETTRDEWMEYYKT